MAKKKLNFKKELTFLLYITFVFLILLLSIFNLQNINKKPVVKVLGIEDEVTYDDKSFWQDLVVKNPTYRDGWIELRRLDKIKEIDPNYFK